MPTTTTTTTTTHTHTHTRARAHTHTCARLHVFTRSLPRPPPHECSYILDNLDVYIVPIVNVDGYIYTWTNNRLWRKNRRDNGGGVFGVDINRNWG